jgi:hypothetical protein
LGYQHRQLLAHTAHPDLPTYAVSFLFGWHRPIQRPFPATTLLRSRALSSYPSAYFRNYADPGFLGALCFLSSGLLRSTTIS